MVITAPLQQFCRTKLCLKTSTGMHFSIHNCLHNQILLWILQWKSLPNPPLSWTPCSFSQGFGEGCRQEKNTHRQPWKSRSAKTPRLKAAAPCHCFVAAVARTSKWQSTRVTTLGWALWSREADTTRIQPLLHSPHYTGSNEAENGCRQRPFLDTWHDIYWPFSWKCRQEIIAWLLTQIVLSLTPAPSAQWSSQKSNQWKFTGEASRALILGADRIIPFRASLILAEVAKTKEMPTLNESFHFMSVFPTHTLKNLSSEEEILFNDRQHLKQLCAGLVLT